MRRLAPFLALLPLVLLACKKELACPAGQSACGDACVALASDAANCGACGNACGTLEVCSAGACGCTQGTTACGGACTDLRSDPSHCGACDTSCGGGTPYCATTAATACLDACPAGLTACGLACVDQQADRLHCGACGVACAEGQTCRGGACHSDVHVACGATAEIYPVTTALAPAGDPRLVSDGLTALTLLDGVLYSASGYPAAAVDLTPLDADVTLPVAHVGLGGSDLQGIAVHDNVVFVTNAGVGTLVILGLDGTTLDEIPVGAQQTGPNPRGLAFVGQRAYVALGGSDDTSGQALAVVDLAGLQACAAEAAPVACGAGGACASGRHCVDDRCRLPCGRFERTIDLKVAGAYDAPGAPFPSRALAVGSKVYVTLGNLKFADFGGGFAGWFQPAGSGRLAVVDTARADAVSVVDLGASCGNPGGMALSGSTLWVACGSLSFAADWPARLLPVSLATAPAPGAPIDPSPVIPNGVVICGGVGYVPDMSSGLVRTFDPATGAFGEPVEVCPLSGGPFPFAYVADVACTP
jgi:hypothetical protein